MNRVASKGAGPTPKVGRLIGSGSKGRQGGNVQGASTQPKGMGDPTAPASMGTPDIVADRLNQASAGAMLHKQLKANKSSGLKP